MANLRQNPVVSVDKKSPEYAVRQYNNARTNLLVALGLTVVNIVLGILGANLYMLFSISFPYYMFDVSDLLWSIPAIIVFAVYAAYYFLCKKYPGFMIAALVTFILDFLFLIGYSLILCSIPELDLSVADFLVEYLTHIWVLAYLITGTRYSRRYKAAVENEPTIVSGNIFSNAAIPTNQTYDEPKPAYDQPKQAYDEPNQSS